MVVFGIRNLLIKGELGRAGVFVVLPFMGGSRVDFLSLLTAARTGRERLGFLARAPMVSKLDQPVAGVVFGIRNLLITGAGSGGSGAS